MRRPWMRWCWRRLAPVALFVLATVQLVPMAVVSIQSSQADVLSPTLWQRAQALWDGWSRQVCLWMGRCQCLMPPWQTERGALALSRNHEHHFVKVGDSHCFRHGSLLNLSESTSGCVCRPEWSGPCCSFPSEVTSLSKNQLNMKVTPRLERAPRRIIHAFPFNNEFEMLETRLAELHELVDVFLVLESNYSASGQPKALRLLERLRAGFYSQYTCKIVHVFLDHFPPGALKNGWIADNILRNHLAKQGLVHQLSNFSSDDIFLMTDADELPYPSTLWFLRLHDGYPEPIGYFLHANVFGFFWQGTKGYVHVICAVTVGLLTQVLENNAIEIRSAPHYLNLHRANLKAYMKADNSRTIRLWSFGSKTSPAGWHCSWCCKPDCIRSKLLSAQNGDFPRWGDYPEKTNLSYIEKLIDNGTWFDNVSRFKPRNIKETKNFAPPYVLKHFDTYKHILIKPQYPHESPNKVVHTSG